MSRTRPSTRRRPLANPTSFNYTVTKAGKDLKVKAKFKAVSRAGVAEDELDPTHRSGHQPHQRHLHPTRRRKRLDLRVDGESGIRPFHGSPHGRLRRPVQHGPRELHRDRLWKRRIFFPRPVLLLDERKRARSRSALQIRVSSSCRGSRKRTPIQYIFTIQPAAGAELTYPIAISPAPIPKTARSTEWFAGVHRLAARPAELGGRHRLFGLRNDRRTDVHENP